MWAQRDLCKVNKQNVGLPNLTVWQDKKINESLEGAVRNIHYFSRTLRYEAVSLSLIRLKSNRTP